MREYGFKSEYVKRFRAITDSVGLRLPLPRINPSLVSALSVVTSLAFLLVLKHFLLPLRAAFIVAFWFVEVL